MDTEQTMKARVDARCAQAEAEALAETFGMDEFERRLAALEARFPNEQAETRTVGIRFRVTPEERTRYLRAAADAGLRLSEWLRMRCERL